LLLRAVLLQPLLKLSNSGHDVGRYTKLFIFVRLLDIGARKSDQALACSYL
jgi:hypothetical protein